MFNIQPYQIGNYFTIEKLNSDTDSEKLYSIYSVKNFNFEIFILILYPRDFSVENFAKTIQVYTHLGLDENPHFLRYISNSNDEMIVREKYIVLEFVEKTSLKKFLFNAGFFSEKLTKIIVWKIFHAIIDMHEKGIIHCKISLESFISDGNYNFKIFGFEFAEFIQEENEKQIKIKKDLIRLAILIIQLLTGKNDLERFENKIKSDKIKSDNQKEIQKKQKEKLNDFWTIVKSNNLEKIHVFTKELEDLINKMLLGTINDVKELLNLDWFNEVRTSIGRNEFEEYEQYMREQLKKYEEDDFEI